MAVKDYTVRPEAAREEALILFINAIQAAPETVPKDLDGEKFADYLISGAKKIIEYIDLESAKK